MVVVECGGANYALRVSGNRFSIAWNSGAGVMVPIIAGDSVFGLSRGGTLAQLRLSNGHTITSSDVGGGATSFPQAAAAGHTLVAPAGRGIVVFSI